MILTNLEATRKRLPAGAAPTGAQVMSRHFEICKSKGSYKPLPPCSSNTSLPATPMSAAPLAT